MADLAQFEGLAKAQDEGIDVSIVHPKTGEPLDITIRVAGPDSARQRRIRAELNNERLAKNKKRMTASELEEDALRVTVAAIIGWCGVLENGQQIEFSKSAATDLLTRYPFIHDQIIGAVSDRASFIEA